MHNHKLVEVTNRLAVALAFTVAILVLEVVGGVLSNSLALLSDAAHVLTDILAIAMAWFAARQAQRPPTLTRTFGFHRTGILAATANASMLILIAGFVCYQAYQRLLNPQPVEGGLLLAVATFGLIGNVSIALYLRSEQAYSLSVRSAVLHVVGDAAASVGVIAGGLIIYFTGFTVVDPVLSVIISLIIVWGAWRILTESVNILMEGTPKEVDVEHVTTALLSLPGIQDVHDLHVWSIATGLHSLSCHVLVGDLSPSESSRLLMAINRTLDEQFNITHSTVQFERERCGLVCTLSGGRITCR